MSIAVRILPLEVWAHYDPSKRTRTARGELQLQTCAARKKSQTIPISPKETMNHLFSAFAVTFGSNWLAHIRDKIQRKR
jgi:hypothetical protein